MTAEPTHSDYCTPLGCPTCPDSARDRGTIWKLLETARDVGCLCAREQIRPELVLEELPFDWVLQRRTGYSRFVRLRNLQYALVR